MPYVHMSGAESCGPDQEWDPDAEFRGIKGQCVPKGSVVSWTDVAKAALKVGLRDKPRSGSSSTSNMAPPADNTLVYVGVGAVALLAVILLSRD
jgi:hypothetical protein